MIRGVVFDMDGLMFDTETLAKECWLELSETEGYGLDYAFYLTLCGLNRKSAELRFKERLGADFDFEGASAKCGAMITQRIEKQGMPVKPGLTELLSYLKEKGISVTVATSTAREQALYRLEKGGVLSYFDRILCGDMVEKGKPDPEIYQKAAALLGLLPEECLALEDSIHGIYAASAAGLMPVMIPDLIAPTPELESLLYAKLESLDQVIGLLEKNRL